MGRNRCDPGQLAQEVGPVKKSLPSMDWRERPGLDRLLAALDADEDMARYVGGAVRDTLLGFPVADVDIATRHLPRNVMDRLAAAGIKAVPTGIDHGPITRPEEQTSALKSLIRISYAVFSLTKQHQRTSHTHRQTRHT